MQHGRLIGAANFLHDQSNYGFVLPASAVNQRVLSVTSLSVLIVPSYDMPKGISMQKAFQSINSRILLLPVLAVLALLVAGGLSIMSIGDITLEEHQARARAVVEAAVKIVEMFESKAATGEMSEQDAQVAAKEALRAIRYDNDG